MKENLTSATVREFLDYDRETGAMTWRSRARHWFTTDRAWRIWNRRYAGVPAGRTDAKGYSIISIFGSNYKAHRLAYLIVTGNWPPSEIDHKNHVRNDNRWENIRPVSCAENRKNVSRDARNTSGTVGVHWLRHSKKWRAQIGINGVRRHLGMFSSKEDAVATRRLAEALHGYHENHWKVAT